MSRRLKRSGSMPAATTASSKESRSCRHRVRLAGRPNGASPQFCESNHRQCLMNRGFGFYLGDPPFLDS
jgi:hypothetical protein